MAQMIKRKTWEEFRKTGLVLQLNRFLHIFGWAIVFEFDKVDCSVLKEIYPARCKFRGFDEKSETQSFIDLSEYMVNNAKELLKESKE